MAILFESLCLDIIALSSVTLGLLYYYFTATFDYWEKKGVPFVKPLPFFGNVMDQALFIAPEGLTMKRIYEELDGHPFGGGFQFRQPFLILRDPDMVKQFLVKDFSHFQDRGFPVDEVNRPLSAHLFNLGGSKWRGLRMKLTPTFTSGKMKMMYQLMVECAEQLRQHMEAPAAQGKELEFREVLAQFTTDIIGTCAFGLQFNSMNDSKSEFREMGRKVFDSTVSNTIRRLLLVFLPSVAKLLNMSFEPHEVTQFFTTAVKETVDYREKNNVVRNDFLQLLIQLKNKGRLEDDHDTKERHAATAGDDAIELTDNLLAAQVFVFFLAGFETSSTALSFALYELALNPDVQTRLREEVDSVLEGTNGQITYEALQKMDYLDKVISETLRKYPPGTVLIRVCTKPYTVPGTDVQVEEGTRVFVPVYALHHDPRYYPEPDRFDPERFSEENKKSRPHYTYMPFGEGPRICIGMRFGLMQAKLGLAFLLRHFEFSPSQKTAVPIVQDPKSLVLASVSGIWLKITKRT